MTIDEPTTALTDFALAIVGLAFGVRHLARPATFFWGFGFCALGVAAACGGVWHGFHGLDLPVRSALWKGTLANLGTAAAAFLIATAQEWTHPRTRVVLVALAATQLVLWILWIRTHDAFVWVTMDFVPTFGVMLFLSLRAARRGEGAGRWIAAGVVLAVTGGVVQAFGPDLHDRFGRNDLYHVVQIAALFLLDAGITRLPVARLSSDD